MKTKRAIIMLLAAVLLVASVLLVACGRQAPTISFVSPAKTSYVVGETLDLTGSKIVTKHDDGTKEEADLVLSMLEATTLPNMAVAGEYVVKGSYNQFDFSFKVTVMPNTDTTIVGIEAKFIDGTNYVRTQSVYDKLLCRTVHANGTKGEWYYINEEDVTAAYINGDKLFVDVEQVLEKKTFTTTVSLEFVESQPISVSQLKQSALDGEYLVKGVLISIATAITTEEFVIADPETGDIIGVVGLQTSGLIYNYNFDTHGFEIGDELVLPVSLRQKFYTSSSATGRIFAEYEGGTAYSTAVASKGNTVNISKENAVVIDSQQDLAAFLTEPARRENHYKIVKIVGQVNLIPYTNSAHLRFWIEDGIVDSLEEQRVGGGYLSPCFNDASQYYTTGKTFTEMLFGKQIAISEDWSNPTSQLVEMYALYFGGNNYYHEFVILDEADVKIIEPGITGVEASTQQSVMFLGNQFDPTKASLTVKYNNRSPETVAVTADMLDATTYPNTNVAGVYTVKGSYEGFEFSFNVEVMDKAISSISVAAMPNVTTYTHRDTPASFDLTGGKISVNYTNGDTEIVDMTADMFTADRPEGWGIGEVAYPISYLGFTTTATFTIQNTALSITEFLAGTVGQTYDVTGIIVGPASSHGAAELVIKDKNGNSLLSIFNTGAVGTYTDISLDTELINVGDEVIISAKLTLTGFTNTGLSGRLYADANGLGFAYNTLVVSQGNPLNMAALKADAVEIDSQEDLKAFINAGTNFYKVAKLVGVKGVVAFDGYRAFFGNDVKAVADQRFNGGYMSPFIYRVNANYYLTNDLQTYFSNPESTDFANPATTEATIYVMFIGGNIYYYDLVVMDDSWVEIVPYKLTTPTKTVYTVGEQLDLTGCALVPTISGEQVAVTAQMLDATTYNMSQAGNYTVRGSYNGFAFEFAIEVKAQQVQSIAVVGTPSKQSIMASKADVSNAVCQLMLEVSYSTGAPEQVAITASMLTIGDLVLGDNVVTVTYADKTTTVTITLENDALTVSQIKQKPAGSQQYALTGVVFASTFIGDITPKAAYGELLIREKGSNAVIGIKNTGLSGTDYLAGLQAGDEIVVVVTMGVTSTNANESEVNKVAPSMVSGSNVMVLSKGNNIQLDLAQATTVASFADLTAWLQDSQTRLANMYRLVRLPAGTQFVNYSASNRSMYLAFDCANAAGTKVDGRYPYFIDMNYAPAHGSLDILQEFFGTSTINNSWTNKSVLTKDAYVMYVGGQGIYYHHFIWLGSNYIAAA